MLPQSRQVCLRGRSAHATPLPLACRLARVRTLAAMIEAPTEGDSRPEHSDQRQALANLFATSEGVEAPEAFSPPPQPTAPIQELPKQGDIVYGTVIFANDKGARVQLMGYDDLIGWMPEHYSPVELPFRLQVKTHGHKQHATDQQQQQHSQQGSHTEQPADLDASSTSPAAAAASEPAADGSPTQSRNPTQAAKQKGSKRPVAPQPTPVVSAGTSRPFMVMAPSRPGMQPLLSAVSADHKIMLDRLMQIKELNDQENRTMLAKVVGFNSGGCLCSILGLYGQAFLPFGQLQHPPNDGYSRGWSAQNASVLVGCELEVALIQVEPANKKVVVSERAATDMLMARVVQLGNAVSGTVHRVFAWGVDVKLHAVPGAHAQLHKQRITRAPGVPYPADVYQAGDEVVGLLSYVGPDEQRFQRGWLELSTCELEEQDGDMLQRDTREYCFQRAQGYISR